MHYGRSFKFSDKPLNFCETIQLMLTQLSFNPNQTWEGKRGKEGSKRPSWYILLYKFLVTHPNFMKFGNIS